MDADAGVRDILVDAKPGAQETIAEAAPQCPPSAPLTEKRAPDPGPMTDPDAPHATLLQRVYGNSRAAADKAFACSRCRKRRSTSASAASSGRSSAEATATLEDERYFPGARAPRAKAVGVLGVRLARGRSLQRGACACSGQRGCNIRTAATGAGSCQRGHENLRPRSPQAEPTNTSRHSITLAYVANQPARS